MFNPFKKQKIETKPLSGFTELLPDEQIAFNTIRDSVKQTYEMFGFLPIDTPVLERADVLLAKAGGETEKQIYQFTKGDTELAMRFDLTVPLARYVAEHYNDLVFPFRRYAIGKVYRGERAQAGRFREFYQCDIDIVGEVNLDLRNDAEIPNIIYTIFKKLDFGPFTIRINNRKIFNGLFSALSVADSGPLMQVIDKLDKIGISEVTKELENLSLSTDQIEKIVSFIAITGTTEEILAQLRALNIQDEQFITGVSELEEVMRLVYQYGVPEDYAVIDLSIARGLDYYTGTIFETKLSNYPDIGSVCSGGRYDNLASSYTNKKLPGVGASIGLTRLFDQLLKKGVIIPNVQTSTRVLLVPTTDSDKEALTLATTLREKGIPAEISFTNGKVKKSMSYVDKLNIPFVVLIGEDEIASNTYMLKNIKTGEQNAWQIEELLKKIS